MAGILRKLFVTQRGYVGLALNGVRVGDEVRLVHGAGVPFITRPCPTDVMGTTSSAEGAPVQRQLVCEAYIHGIMNGEAISFENVKRGQLTLI